jgi:hypothetical protein
MDRLDCCSPVLQQNWFGLGSGFVHLVDVTGMLPKPRAAFNRARLRLSYQGFSDGSSVKAPASCECHRAGGRVFHICGIACGLKDW